MAIPGILNSLTTAATAPTNQISGKAFEAYFQQRQPLIKALGQELKSGDLAGAQAAYDKLTALASKNGLSNAFLRQDRAADFSAIGAALKNGDVAGAQEAFAVLKQDLGRRSPVPQPVPPGVLPDVVVTINGGGTPSPSPAPIAKPPVPAPAPTPTPGKLPPVNQGPPEVVVSISDQKGSGNPTEQIVLNLNSGSGASGGVNIGISQSSSGEQISLSFGSSGSSPSVQLNLGANKASEIDIAVSQTSAGEQIAISFGAPPKQAAVSAFTTGASSQGTSSALSVSA